MQPEQPKQVIEALTVSQELIERSSFDSINQHDKVANLFSKFVADFNVIMMNLEAMNEQIEKLVESSGDSCNSDQEIDGITQTLVDQSLMIIEASKCLNTIMEEQSKESDTIHEMEMQIAEQRDIIDEVCCILKSIDFNTSHNK